MNSPVIQKIKAKTILSKSGIPGVTWSVNPYTGCRFGCKYCYAYFVGRFRHPDEQWGTYIDVKTNAPELLKKEIHAKTAQSKTPDIGEIFFSSVTDPYQGIEATYCITQKCIEVLKNLDYTGGISVLTKSPLVIRDIDLFLQCKNIDIGMTVTSTDDPISQYLETNAPKHSERMKALKKLHKKGVRTYGFIGPLLPHFVWYEKKLKHLMELLVNSGVSYCYVEHINLSTYIRERLYSYLRSDHPELLPLFKKAQTETYQKELSKLVKKLAKQTGLKIAYNEPITHTKTKDWKKI